MKIKFPTWFRLVIAFFTLGMAIKFSLPQRERCTHANNQCVANLKMIDGAKYEWALAQHKKTGDVPTWDDLLTTNKNLQTNPVCQHGGTYSINAIGVDPTCNLKSGFFAGQIYSCAPHQLPR